jgi:hypothetical protein
MNNIELAQQIKSYLISSYPKIEVKVEPLQNDPKQLAVYFIEDKFSLIYPMQRYHYLIHLLPKEFVSEKLENTIWFELAPNETPGDLEFPDEELIQDITPDVMHCLNKTNFFEALDDLLSPTAPELEPKLCYGDYRHSKGILPKKGFFEKEYFDIFHVLMAQGGYCDCEILFNIANESRFAAEYWKNRDKKHNQT